MITEANALEVWHYRDGTQKAIILTDGRQEIWFSPEAWNDFIHAAKIDGIRFAGWRP